MLFRTRPGGITEMRSSYKGFGGSNPIQGETVVVMAQPMAGGCTTKIFNFGLKIQSKGAGDEEKIVNNQSCIMDIRAALFIRDEVDSGYDEPATMWHDLVLKDQEFDEVLIPSEGDVQYTGESFGTGDSFDPDISPDSESTETDDINTDAVDELVLAGTGDTDVFASHPLGRLGEIQRGCIPLFHRRIELDVSNCIVMAENAPHVYYKFNFNRRVNWYVPDGRYGQLIIVVEQPDQTDWYQEAGDDMGWTYGMINNEAEYLMMSHPEMFDMPRVLRSAGDHAALDDLQDRYIKRLESYNWHENNNAINLKNVAYSATAHNLYKRPSITSYNPTSKSPWPRA